jgi:hypothetical protein
VITLAQYEQIRRIMKPLFLIFLVLFFIKEFSYLLDMFTGIQIIPDLLFLTIFAVYAFFDFLPYFKPEYIEDYVPPEPDTIDLEVEENTMNGENNSI